MAKPRNEAVATCPCPVRDCAVTDAKVFRFRGRENELQRRLAGKFYLQCPEHGRFGADGKQSAIDYITENMTWLPKNDDAAPENHDAKPTPAPTPAPAKLPVIPAPAPATAQAKRRDIWEL